MVPREGKKSHCGFLGEMDSLQREWGQPSDPEAISGTRKKSKKTSGAKAVRRWAVNVGLEQGRPVIS